MSRLSTEQLAAVSDEILVDHCQKGDRQSFQMLYRRYQKKVRSTLYQLCGEAVLDDLVQDVFLKAWQGLPKLRNPQYFSTWLYRICWNVATDQRRRFAKRQTTSIDMLPESSSQFAAADSGGLATLHYQDLVQQGLQMLSLDQRAVLVLHDLKDLPQKEVAEILSVPVGTVKSRLHHGRRSLRQFLESQGVQL
ncbi:sigma-70 family RNA polymerase sigma factor [[Limnothrix rosea] IAM M-220]|uniref:sigma-70 family RNA polymerase sigma factor n=1 Tax=[Limnothrix rosea] IAM M-220 TaxID=454133 RepID=UPI0009672350|nr:sigma-70 family RNA polymerase sigma factor [[Limnothrix rosea] IAM M-220]OKH14163.1 RNA polymerase subunit sigma [[Limnothrix rosea] IAM M-220]